MSKSNQAFRQSKALPLCRASGAPQRTALPPRTHRPSSRKGKAAMRGGGLEASDRQAQRAVDAAGGGMRSTRSRLGGDGPELGRDCAARNAVWPAPVRCYSSAQATVTSREEFITGPPCRFLGHILRSNHLIFCEKGYCRDPVLHRPACCLQTGQAVGILVAGMPPAVHMCAS